MSVMKSIGQIAKTFIKEEDGAITVDWVVLTAGLVGLALAIGVSVGGGAADAGSLLSSEVANMTVGNF